LPGHAKHPRWAALLRRIGVAPELTVWRSK